MEFKPRRVAPKSWRFWFKESLSLSTRNILSFTLLALLVSGAHHLPELLRDFVIFAIPLLLSFGVVLACSVDKSINFLGAVSKTPRVVWVRLFVAGSMPWLILSAFGIVMGLIMQLMGVEGTPPPSFDSGQNTYVIYEAGMSMLATMFVWLLILGYFLWFVIPLIVVAELPLIESFDQSLDALLLNGWFVRIILSFSFSAFLFALFFPILFIPWYAVTSSMMYVSFRYIWMGKRDNNPAPVLSGLAAATSK
ncbi:MAG TPA: hypothetical protein EYP59_04045 [Thiotrichaceae bacterium]|nr:hypothetical protein [Thiotrichaceae bacterium]